MLGYFKHLARFALLAFLSLTLVAVGLSRTFPKHPPSWFTAPTPYHAVISSAVCPTDRSTLWLDTTTGQLRRDAPIPGGILEHTSWSPWKNDRGDSRIAGRLSSWTNDAKYRVSDGGSLAVVNKSDGTILRAGDLDFAITGQPCWLPDRPDRLIVPAGNGKLYRFDLPTEEGVGSISPTGEIKHRALTWACAPPGEGTFFLSDPISPFVDGFERKLIVSLRRYAQEDASPSLPTEIWWLQLDQEQESIIAAGRLTPPRPEAPGEPGLEERYPNLCRDSKGLLFAAYLVRDSDAREWRLRVAPVTTARDGGDPAIETSSVREVARNCAPTVPAFSTDGRWVYRVARYQTPASITERFPTDPAVNTPLAINGSTRPDESESSTH